MVEKEKDIVDEAREAFAVYNNSLGKRIINDLCHEIARLRPLLSEVQDQRTLINSQVAEIERLRAALKAEIEYSKEAERAAARACAAVLGRERGELTLAEHYQIEKTKQSRG